MTLATLKPRLIAASLTRTPVLQTKAGTTERLRGRAWIATRERVAKRHDYRCARCGAVWVSSRDHIDHIVEAERPGDADVIIAAGWNQSRIGGALLRLHTEFDSSEKPRMATAEQFLSAGKTTKERRAHAARQAHAFNLHETALLLGKLKALPEIARAAEPAALKTLLNTCLRLGAGRHLRQGRCIPKFQAAYQGGFSFGR